MIEVILWDVDGTLLDFKASEREAMRQTFRHFDLGELSDEDIAAYSAINQKWWTRMELGEVTKPQVLNGRFGEFFAELGLSFTDFDAYNAVYQTKLGETAVPMDNSIALLTEFREMGLKQYAVTNGTAKAQRMKLKKSGLDQIFNGIFISEDIGFEKPSPRFFQAVFDAIGPVDREKVMIVGDSVTGDMRGGRDAGIATCLYRPTGDFPVEDVADHCIRHLSQVKKLLK